MTRRDCKCPLRPHSVGEGEGEGEGGEGEREEEGRGSRGAEGEEGEEGSLGKRELNGLLLLRSQSDTWIFFKSTILPPSISPTSCHLLPCLGREEGEGEEAP